MSATATMQRSADLRAKMAPQVGDGGPPGLVALVSRGEGAEIAAVGMTERGGATPLEPDAIFRIASMTKPIVAAAALLLVDDGKLALDAPIDRLLPELANRRVLKRPDAALDDTAPAARPITVEDLLTNRMGLGLLFASPDTHPILAAIAEKSLTGFGPPDPNVAYGPDEFMRRLGELPLMAQPGERWLYNTASEVLGVLVARASGQTLPDFCAERLFGPLGMADTGFSLPANKLARLPVSYWSGDAVFDAGGADSAWSRAPSFPSGAAGLAASAQDIFRFSRFLLSGGLAGGRRLLSETLVRAMTRDHLTAAQQADGDPILCGRGWGYGVSVVLRDEAGGAPAGAFGWNGGLGTSWIMDPASDTTAILMTQLAFASPDPPPAHKALAKLAFG